jgi:hypothetical protein
MEHARLANALGQCGQTRGDQPLSPQTALPAGPSRLSRGVVAD